MIAVIGDVHTRDRDLQAALTFAAFRGVDEIYCTGDLVDGPGDPHRVFALLREFGVRSVRGNHDAWCLAGTNVLLPRPTPLARLSPAEAADLESLPLTLAVRPDVLLCHGLGDDFLARLDQDDGESALGSNAALRTLTDGGPWRLVLNGHSHRPLARTIGPTLFLGAGVLGSGRGLVLVDPETREWSPWAVRNGGVEPGL